MRVFVAGASGVIGLRLIPQLIERGHQVVGTTRSHQKTERLRALGAEPVVLDLLDAAAVRAAVMAARPDAIIHQGTALAQVGANLRHFDRTFAPTNLLRTLGTDALLAAAREAGVRRVLAQSFTGWPYARQGRAIKTEADPLDPAPAPAMRESLAAIRHLERAVIAAGGLALRYGGFYGSRDDAQIDLIRRRMIPIVGDGGGISSFVHLDDAAAATVLALERGDAGAYNIVDDEPAPVREWLPALARAVGARPPRHVPRWLARLLAGDAVIVLMCESRGASNAKAKRDLGWTLRHPTWRRGFFEAYAAPSARPVERDRSDHRLGFDRALSVHGPRE